ncbi:MAG: addiction module protein [Bacteroidetes bacterium]|nr:addiction module protein [Bacteroidota bacterium]
MSIHSTKIDIIQWLTQLNDKEILAKIQAIKQEDDNLLSASQKAELNRRIAKYEKGEMKFKSWNEVKRNIRKKVKNAA